MDSQSGATTNGHLVHPDKRIGGLASRQHGLVTIAQLRRLGLSHGAIRTRRETGRLRPVHGRVYAVGHDALDERGRMLAAVMACGSSALLSHIHAASVWGLLPPWEQPDAAHVHVTVPAGCRRGRRAGIVVHQSRLEPSDRAVQDAIPLTVPHRTILDLGALAGPRATERAIDRALTESLTTIRALRDCAAEHRGARGAGVLRSVLDAAERFDGVTDSELEDAFIAVVRAAGLPEPRRNGRICGMRIDAVWPQERVAVELDGYRWHRTRRRAEGDRERELRLRAAGWLVLRYSARQVFEEPVLVAADLARTLTARRGAWRARSSGGRPVRSSGGRT